MSNEYSIHSLKDCKPLNRNKKVYRFIQEQSLKFGISEITKTEYPKNKNRYSDNSYSFITYEKESFSDVIKRTFNIKQYCNVPNNFDKRMLTLHSSELAAFLCFENISETNPITFECIPNVVFTSASFEKSLTCIGGGPSRIDVVLYNKDKSVAFYIEAKFSEYLNPSSKSISKKYRLYYKNYNIESSLPNEIIYEKHAEKSKKEDLIKSNNNNSVIKHVYCEGIKQIISHYIALNESDNSEKKVYLGCLLFDFGKETKKYIEDYSCLYSTLAKNLNKNNLNRKVYTIESILTYQDVFKKFSNILPSKVRSYYNL